MNYYKILDNQGKIVLINQTLLANAFNIVSAVNPYVNTQLLYEGRVFARNDVEADSVFHLQFFAEIQQTFFTNGEEILDIDYVDILNRSKIGRLNDATTERAVDNTVSQILIADNSMNKTDTKPDLFRLSSTDLNIVMITKSGNVMAHIGESDVLLVNKTLFNKLCRQPMWCCIDSMMIDDREISCLKGLSFNC